jgi:hypothetical protein
MATDALTPFLGLTKPVVNDPAGEDLWGQKLNGNFDKLDLFASQQGALVEAPQDGKVYGRGTPFSWLEVPAREEFDALAVTVGQNVDGIVDVENVNTAQDVTIAGKAPLGPNDGKTYGWRGTTWFDITTSLSVDWANISGKPATFPPTLPIPSSGVTGLDAKQSSQDTAIAAINWNSLSGKPATFPPTLPIPSSGVTGLDAKQTSQDADIAAKPGEAPTDGQLYSRKGSTASWVIASAGAVVSDTPPTGMPVSTIWWNSASGGLFIDYQDPNTRQWVMVNAAGMPEANKDGKAYARKDGAWFDLTASFTAKADLSYVNTELAKKFNTTGGTIGGAVGITTTLQVTGTGSPYAITSGVAGGGIIGFGSTGSIYAISGYGGYSLYTSGPHSMGGTLTVTGDASTTGFFTTTQGGSDVQTSTANCVMTTNGTIRRTTSSIRYKTDVETLQDPWADKVLDLVPIYYRPKDTSDPEGYTRYGFSAEQCYTVDPRFSTCEPQTLVGYERIEETGPEGEQLVRQGAPLYEDRIDIVATDLNAIVAALQQVIKRQDARIAALEAVRV